MRKIPAIIERFAEGTRTRCIEIDDKFIDYSTADGHKICVYHWCRWPSYDFIFGIPDKSNPNYSKEVGFFQFRRFKGKKAVSAWSIYVDFAEAEEMVDGFLKIMQASKKFRFVEWQKYLKNKQKPEVVYAKSQDST